MQAADRGTQELLTAEREKNPGLTFQQWWDWLEASNTGDPLENTWNEWNNHHLVVEGGTLNLQSWRLFEGTFHKLKNRVPNITEFEATRKVLENLPSRKGETDWLHRVTQEEQR